MWIENMGHAGACNDCKHDDPMSFEDEKLWTCKANGDIALKLRDAPDARKCLSWSTEGACEFRMKDVLALQAHLTSAGCNGLWVCPLWIAPQNWQYPQHATGEIDIFERGCAKNDGYLLSFGEKDSWIVNDAWKEAGQPEASTCLTAYMTFDAAQDVISVYKCPFNSDPLRHGPDDAGCGPPTATHRGYFADTREQTNGGTEWMAFVSDVWNACPLSCGNAVEKTECSFEVSGIQMKFTEESTAAGKSPFRDPDRSVCRSLISP